MYKKISIACALLGVLAMPVVAQAQGIPGGAVHGAAVGNNAAGPVGAVVGGVVGGVIGGVEGALGVDRVYYRPDMVPEPRRHYRRHYTARRVRHHG
jgi:hypothetical protein